MYCFSVLLVTKLLICGECNPDIQNREGDTQLHSERSIKIDRMILCSNKIQLQEAARVNIIKTASTSLKTTNLMQSKQLEKTNTCKPQQTCRGCMDLLFLAPAPTPFPLSLQTLSSSFTSTSAGSTG